MPNLRITENIFKFWGYKQLFENILTDIKRSQQVKQALVKLA